MHVMSFRSAVSRLGTSGVYLSLALTIVLVVVLLLVNFGISATNTRRLSENHRRVLESVENLRQLKDVLSIMKDAETGQRGYLVTGKDEYLEPYNSALRLIKKSVEAIGPNLVESGNRDQFEALKSEIDIKLDELQKTVVIRRDRGLDAAVQEIMTDRGKRAMDRIRDILNQEETVERSLLTRRLAESDLSLGRVFSAFVVSTVVAFVVLVALTFLVLLYLSSRKQSEKELRDTRDLAMAATRAKGEFLANMSHEIRTPMNGVLGMTDLLLETPLNDLQREYIRTVHTSGEALLTVINDILDFSKIEARKLTLEMAEFDLRAVMEEVVDLLAPSCQRKNLKIVSRVSRAVPRRLIGDPVRIRQVLTNLAGNAVKFTEHGEVILEAHLLAEEGDRAKLRIFVRDTGIGIPADRQTDVFESFTQIEGSNGRRYGGTGLGLTICQSLVMLMGGRIGLESTPGAGSTFWFEADFTKKQSEADASAEPLDGLRVLVIDDAAVERGNLRETLLSWECRPEFVASIDEALTRLRETSVDNPFGLILVVRDRPELEAEPIARVIKAVPGHAEIPIVLLTAHPPAGSDKIDDNLWAGRVLKPFRRSLLFNTLRRIVAAPDSVHVPDPTGDTDAMHLAFPFSILLAEDNEVNREVAISMVKRLGCEVEVVWNGREALKALDYDRHDLILMDVQMPEMDGLAASAAIRKREIGTGRHIPIIALTAHAMQGDRPRCVAAGMDDYLTKPIRLGLLRESLRVWGDKIERASNKANPHHEPEVSSHFGETLRNYCGNDLNLTRKVLELMLSGVPVRLSRLGAAINAEDGIQVSGEAHSLKGMFATVGAKALSTTCQDLMSFGKDQNYSSMENAHQHLRDQWEGLESEATHYLSTLHP